MTDETSQGATIRENRKLRVGLIGCGNVGTGVVNYFLSYGPDKLPGYELVAVGVEHPEKPRDIGLKVRNFEGSRIKIPRFTGESDDIVNDSGIDVIIDAVGGDKERDGNSLNYIRRALAGGKHVITCNKQNLLKNIQDFTAIAERNKVNFRYEPAVCGGVPVIRTIRDYFAGDEITKIVGIINGTSNYILTSLGKGGSLDDAVKEAVRAGIAESNPSYDLSGKDAAAKLAILASLAFGTRVHENDIITKGLENISMEDQFVMKTLSEEKKKKYMLKSIAVAERRAENLELRVHPAFINEDHPLFGVDNSTNGIAIVGRHSGTYVLKGPGAGTGATSYAIIGDLLELEEKIREKRFKNFKNFSRRYEHNKDISSRGYFRSTSPENQPGVFAKKCQIIADHGININKIINFPEEMAIGSDQLLPDVICTDRCKEEQIRRATADLRHTDVIRGETVYIAEDETR